MHIAYTYFAVIENIPILLGCSLRVYYRKTIPTAYEGTGFLMLQTEALHAEAFEVTFHAKYSSEAISRPWSKPLKTPC